MPEVRTFKAATMQAALAVVRQEFGSEAVILHTRETPASRWPWSRRVAEVEVTAGRDVMLTSRPALRQVVNAAVSAISSISAVEDVGSPTLPTPSLRVASPSPVEAPGASRPTIQGLSGRSVESHKESKSPALASATQNQADLNHQIHSLQGLLQQLTSRLEPDQADVPPELFATYTQLIDADVPEPTARRMISQLKHEHPGSDWSHASAMLGGLVERDLRCCGAIRVTPGQRKVVALVGPTGVGKTTTIAKLAANFKLRAGLRVGLVTVDTYRIAAVEQLRTYAEIIDIAMKVVSSPRDLNRALDELADLDLVLIDTAGRSPADELQLQELKNMLSEDWVDEVHLVLSLAASTRSLINTARQFSRIRAGALILTKLDESPGLGQLLGALPELSLPISYLTTGQNVPDDIEPAVSARLSRLVLGIERLRT